VDVSSDALDVACETISASLPEVSVSPIVANYVTHPPQLESFNGTTLGLYIGSSIGNFTPEEARRILRNLRGQLQSGDALLLGVDMVKDEPTLVAAYDDRDGVTAEFNLNMLHRLNRELDADFDTAKFRHRALWNSAYSRIEMHLESTRDQRVRIAGANLEVCFAKGERIHTENSFLETRALSSNRRGRMSEDGFLLCLHAFDEPIKQLREIRYKLHRVSSRAVRVYGSLRCDHNRLWAGRNAARH
jgi:L-histidine Nalpha-methyltransferase